MEISVDFTFVIQIVSFLVLWAVLKSLLFDPMLAVLDERERRTSGSREAATHIHADVQGMRALYDDRLREARQASLEELEASRQLTAAEERTVLGAARDQGAARLATARVEISRQVEEAKVTLNQEAAVLASQIVEKVVGRSLT